MPSRLPNTIGELTAKDRRSGGLWVSEIGMYLLWFEYLAISPSYQLARLHRSGKNIETGKLPLDFERVLSVYDDLGDTQEALFRLWWKDVGLKHFGHQGMPPEVTRVGYAPHQTQNTPDMGANISDYFNEDWVEQGRQRTLLLAIPVGLPEGKINRQIKKQLAKIKPERRKLIEPAVKYPLVGQRHHRDALMRYLRMVWFRSAWHRRSLWRVGAHAKISMTYSPVLDPSAADISEADRYDREMLTIIASRALLRGRMIAENAARGRFPTHEKCPHALELDFKELRQRIHRRNKWQDKEIARLNRLFPDG
ncbi:hypothetical protein SAMN05444000_13311 [Shimia gijangensis]|uniref:Uncharacterized protein n=1 Tax=Shimia gijangensis TaxID=1470563 RepID=A0A1M6SXK1_9RHOB|nr:hypothetical protein [Shimia gijangensis]SHK49462.1 hypothetical protein SAMN05444000_13311 [Shimia gijangensis]